MLLRRVILVYSSTLVRKDSMTTEGAYVSAPNTTASALLCVIMAAVSWLAAGCGECVLLHRPADQQECGVLLQALPHLGGQDILGSTVWVFNQKI